MKPEQLRTPSIENIIALKKLYEIRKEEYSNLTGNESPLTKAQYHGALYVTERILKDLEELIKNE